ncbi:MAG: hypothetical protein A2840_01160 [Candidatus Buchananbacteria bacterium RIFCSPHIGHO2_01_FULL_47_11b]|uniref:Response regulatory domain-containing protein n=1 Tax=Candidatus Buchananbacteria bacterium RIFCSPHIGHO2_01_FULL_47_11b TaxID=1797537 RepID=A0A1G1Y5J4_9BACT|nr:MAG: hypothetical protein A2840_01160 [Candidatus Buchananbacteria bacterium RIFCSPHIGHO2_01_FULL_47_11b]
MAQILVIEAEEMVRTVLERILTRDGHGVTLTSSGEDGLSQALVGGFDLIITDLEMPGLSGVEVLDILRGTGNDAPVILISGDPAKGIAVKDQFTAFLSKPFQINELTTVVNHILND